MSDPTETPTEARPKTVPRPKTGRPPTSRTQTGRPQTARPKTVAPGNPVPIADAAAKPAAKPRIGKIAIAAGAGVACVVVIALVAFLRPRASGGHHAGASDAAVEDGSPVAEPALTEAAPFAETEGPSTRPAAGAGIPALVAADAAYEANDFPHARDLYLDLLLTGGGFGEDGDAVVRWAHGRLALSLARVARGGRPQLLDEPRLDFREERR